MCSAFTSLILVLYNNVMYGLHELLNEETGHHRGHGTVFCGSKLTDRLCIYLLLCVIL